jgi:hypothetical protein
VVVTVILGEADVQHYCGYSTGMLSELVLTTLIIHDPSRIRVTSAGCAAGCPWYAGWSAYRLGGLLSHFSVPKIVQDLDFLYPSVHGKKRCTLCCLSA